MGASRTPAQLAAKMRAASALIADPRLVGLNATALFVTQSIRSEVTKVAGSDNRLSGVGTRGARVGAGYTVLPSGKSAIVQARGPLHLVERDTKAHSIEPKRRRRGGVKRAVVTPAGPRRRVQHPGTRGQHPFERGVLKAAPVAPDVFMKSISTAFRKVFS